MIDYGLKNRAKSESIVPAESRGEAYDWDRMREFWCINILVPYARIELRQDSSIAGTK